MSLTRKILAAVMGTFLISVLGLGTIATRLVLERYKALERDIVRRDVVRACKSLEDELNDLASTCGDWAPWDDTRDFVIGNAPDYVERNLDVPTVANLRLTFMAFYDVNRELVHLAYINLDEGTDAEPPPSLLRTLEQTSGLFHHAELNRGRTGIMLINSAPYLLATCAITDNDHTPPASGTLIVGREFSANQMRLFADKTHEGLSFIVAHSGGFPPDVRGIWEAMDDENPVYLAPLDDTTLAGFTGITDFAGRPAMIMRIEFARAILQQGINAARTFAFLIAVAAILTMIALIVLLHRIAIDPIVRLREHVRAVGDTKDLTREFSPSSSDEIGMLARAFNDMAAKLHLAQTELKETHQKLVVTARQAGMAEVASDVLHNVGNVLNSVNTCVAVLRRELGESRVENLGRTLDLIDEHQDDLADYLIRDEKGQKVLPYLRGVSVRLKEEQSEAAQTLENLTRHVQHITEIISVQQSFAKAIGVIEDVDLNDVIDDAVNICSESLARNHVELIVEREELPVARLDRHQLMQILVNLLTNARNAVCCQSKSNGRQIWLRAAADGGGWIHIDVVDNGVGIPEENLKRIFSHGFTTRRDGHGFGLHSAALAAKQMDGHLEAFSEGEGKGARFTLTIPVGTDGGTARDRD